MKRRKSAQKGLKRKKGLVRRHKTGLRSTWRQIEGKKGVSKPRPKLLKRRLWELCKRLTRQKYGFQCYTCGRPTPAPHTGHFIPSSLCSVPMRYDLRNLRPQCYRCNINLSGNWIAYEENLTRECGDTFVQQLKDENRLSTGGQYDSLWYLAKIAEYEQALADTQTQGSH